MSVLVVLCTFYTTCFGHYWWPSSGGLYYHNKTNTDICCVRRFLYTILIDTRATGCIMQYLRNILPHILPWRWYHSPFSVALKTKKVCSSETFVPTFQISQFHNPEDQLLMAEWRGESLIGRRSAVWGLMSRDPDRTSWLAWSRECKSAPFWLQNPQGFQARHIFPEDGLPDVGPVCVLLVCIIQ
jgi:hypothetical protein